MVGRRRDRRPNGWACLAVDGREVALAEVARSHRSRRRGLLGRPPGPHALVLERTRSVHGLGMGRPLSVAQVSGDGRVVAVHRLRPGGLVRARRGVVWVLEAEVGSFARWGIEVGSLLALRPTPPPPPR